MKIKFTWDGYLLLDKALELCNMIVVVSSVYHEGNKYYLEVFLDECLHRL